MPLLRVVCICGAYPCIPKGNFELRCYFVITKCGIECTHLFLLTSPGGCIMIVVNNQMEYSMNTSPNDTLNLEETFAGYSPETARAYGRHIVEFYADVLHLSVSLDALPISAFVEKVNYDVLEQWLGDRSSSSACTTLNLRKASITFVARTLFEHNLVSRGFWAVLTKVPAPDGHGVLEVHRWLSLDEVTAMFVGANQQPNRVRATRDIALLWVMLTLGLRRGEIANLQWAGYKGNTLHFIGKGSKTYTLTVPTQTQMAIGAWRDVQNLPLTGHLFRRVYRSGRIADEGLTGNGVFKIMRDTWRRSELGGKAVRPHDLRRTASQLGLNEGAKLVELQALLGHSSPGFTLFYLNKPLSGSSGASVSQRIASAIE